MSKLQFGELIIKRSDAEMMNWCYAIRPIRIHKSRQAIIKPLSCCPLQLSLHLRINKAHNDLHSIKKFMRNGILISVLKIWVIYDFKGQHIVKTMRSCQWLKSKKSSRSNDVLDTKGEKSNKSHEMTIFLYFVKSCIMICTSWQNVIV